VVGKRERKARERERKRNIVALLLLLLLRRTAATVLEHVLPVLFALSLRSPTVAHLDHICALLLGLLGLLRVPDERVFAILVLVVVAHAVAANTVAANKTSSRVDADEKRLLGVLQMSSRRGKPTQRREEEEEEEEKEGSPAERERERKTRAKPDYSKHPFYTRGKREREREREKKSLESAGGNAERRKVASLSLCGTISRTNPSNRKEHISHARRVHRFAKLYDFFVREQQRLLRVPVRPELAPASSSD